MLSFPVLIFGMALAQAHWVSAFTLALGKCGGLAAMPRSDGGCF
jgi:hypothetical protein